MVIRSEDLLKDSHVLEFIRDFQTKLMANQIGGFFFVAISKDASSDMACAASWRPVSGLFKEVVKSKVAMIDGSMQ